MTRQDATPERDYDIDNLELCLSILGFMGSHEYIEREVDPWDLVVNALENAKLPPEVATAFINRLRALQQEAVNEQERHHEDAGDGRSEAGA